MKKIIFIILFITLSATIIAQEEKNDSIKTDSNATEYLKENKIKVEGEVVTITTDRFKLYPTSNTYNFIRLDTMTGRLWRVQWHFESNKRLERIVSLKILVDYDEEWINGRFEIYSTENMYNFLLLDKIDGRVWQCQWSFEASENLIVRIY